MENLSRLNPIKSSWEDLNFFKQLQQWNNVLTECIPKDKDNVWSSNDTAGVWN